jgi:hypothetical protein
MSSLSQRKYLKRYTATRRRRLGLEDQVGASPNDHEILASASPYAVLIFPMSCGYKLANVCTIQRIDPPGLAVASSSKTKGVRPSSLRRFSKPHRLHEFIRFTRVLNMIRKRRRHKGSPALDTLNPFYNIAHLARSLQIPLRLCKTQTYSGPTLSITLE